MSMPTDVPEVPLPALRHVRRLALTAAAATYGLIVLGGIVRISGSGLGCPDWPLCYGSLLPPLRAEALIEFSHRLVASLAGFLIAAVTVQCWRLARARKEIVMAASLAAILLVVQIGVGGVTVLLETPPQIVAVHLGLALLILGLLWSVGVSADVRPSVSSMARPIVRQGLALLVLVFALLVSGAVVRGSGASASCGGFPLCDGQLWPRHPLGQLHMLHRFLAFSAALGLIAYSVQVSRRPGARRGERTASAAAAGLGLLQGWIGAQGVLHGFPPNLAGWHVATAAAVWSALVLAVGLAARPPAATLEESSPPRSPAPAASWLSWLMLTKPIILILLLFSTLAGMVAGAGSWPETATVVWTLLGGALTAGGASALNQYTDRASDALMTRTRRRPLPAGQIRPSQALAFGLGLAIAGVLVLALQVNGLSAALAGAGVVYYVVLYGLVLKKTTPQNIVIGGGAGAVPVLVGWAAVTGSVTLPGILLFALVFFWTPAHFWALALVRSQDYRRAGIPMLPVVVGESDTRTQILLYTVQVFTLTLLIGAVSREGWLYFAPAVALGLLLLLHAWLLWRRGSALRAWRMYRYSSLYLALYLAILIVNTLATR